MALPLAAGIVPSLVASGCEGVHFKRGAPLRAAAEYRKEAEEYVRLAERLRESHRRTRFLEMAQACLRLANQAELLSRQGITGSAARSPQPQYSGL